MANTNKDVEGSTLEETSEMEKYARLNYENHSTLPISDRRISDRRISDRRILTRRALDKKSSKTKKITVLIPCYNEEKGIGKVIDDMPIGKLNYLGYQTEIIVINNNSSDSTIKIAKKKGAKVVSEKKQGKGNALRTGFKNVSKDTDYVVMLDGDNTYKSNEVPRLIEPLENSFCDVVIGSRLEGKLKGFSLSTSHRIANWFFTFFVRRFYLINTTDTCSGYFAWKKEVVDKLIHHVRSSGFAIEAEMLTKMAKLGYKIYSVPITYDRREGDSKLSPYLDGIKIIWMIVKNLAWKPSYYEKSVNVHQL